MPISDDNNWELNAAADKHRQAQSRRNFYATGVVKSHESIGNGNWRIDREQAWNRSSPIGNRSMNSPNTRITIRSSLAIAYLAGVLLAAGWAFYTDASLLHSQREHLLPDGVLVVVTLPLSLSTSTLYSAWPEFFSLPFSQAAWATFCGLVQAALLFIWARKSATKIDHQRI